MRTYRELCQIDSYEKRFDYLKLSSRIGVATFGAERYLNQAFYTSHEWRRVRNEVIARDYGCDLGVKDHVISGQVIVHHMNPMTVEGIVNSDDSILDPEYLISVSFLTHNAVHYGDVSLLPKPLVERKPGDTKLW